MSETRTETSKMLNAMTVDVEEHFQVSAFAKVIDRETWATVPSRVVDNTSRLLDLFDECEVHGTFFVLGWVAKSHPPLVRAIADRGHEVASHGMSHRLAYEQTPAQFLDETSRSRKLLQDLSGQSVTGYRCASFSIDRRNLWALDVLAETGFEYDSSLFPIRHDRYGIPGAPRRIHRVRTPNGETLIEVPPSTVRIGKLILPVAGGGYLRLLPAAVTRWAIRRLNDHDRMPAVIYVHPWEIDPGQPRIDVRATTRFRHYAGLEKTAGKLRDLMRRFRFGKMTDVIAASAEPAVVTAGERVLEAAT